MEEKMEFRVLKYFLTVAREENISRAAEVLHVTQPTLSRQLAELEEELGVILFIRGNRKISLTESGILLRRRAEEVLTLMDKLEEEIRQNDQIVAGTLNIGAAEAAATRILPAIMRSFSEKYPNVRYELFTATADIVKERIDKGLIDIGLLTEPVELSKYDYLRLNEKDRWGILTWKESSLAAKESVTADDLRFQPMLVPRRIEVLNNIANWCGDAYRDFQIYASYNLIGNAAMLVRQRLGNALALECTVSIYENRDIVFRPLYPLLESTSVLVWKKYQPANNITKRFIQEAIMLVGNS